MLGLQLVQLTQIDYDHMKALKLQCMQHTSMEIHPRLIQLISLQLAA